MHSVTSSYIWRDNVRRFNWEAKKVKKIYQFHQGKEAGNKRGPRITRIEGEPQSIGLNWLMGAQILFISEKFRAVFHITFRLYAMVWRPG
jgi:hypothetical protein